ncbi:hypothetical protein Q9189_003978 [Teloschistes chrysophthalmus]
MGKSKGSKPAKVTMPAKEAEVKAPSSVKGAAVTKPSQKSKSQSKELAKQVATKSEKSDKKSKKAKKEPTPVPSSDESESDSDEVMSSASSGSSDEEVTTSGAKANGTATNGVSKAKDADTSDSSESSEDESKVSALARATAADSDDDSEEDSDDDSEVEGKIKKTVQAAMGADSEDDSSEDDDEPLETPGAVDAKVLNGKLEKVASKEASAAASSDDADDSASDSDSDSSDEEEDEQEEKPAPSKKRKAETEPAPVSKKPKADAMAATFDDMAKANLFVGNLSWNVDEDWLVREFEKFGEIKNARIMTDRETGRSRGFGYVEFVNYADGIKAQGEMKEAIIDGRTINIDFSQPKKDKPVGDYQDRSKKYGDQTNPPSTTIFCANLDFGATQDEVSEAFGEHGEIKAVRIPTDPGTGQMKGFAYVEFNSLDDATAAFEAMKGTAINGRPIRVDYATTGGVNSGRGGRGRGGFDRGGRGGDRGGRGGRGRGGFSDRGGGRGGRGGSTNRGGFGDFKGKKMTF